MSTSTLAPDQDSVNPNGTAPDKHLTAEPTTPHVVIPPENASASLVCRIAEAMMHAGEVTKSHQNRDQNYKFASAEDILAATRLPLLQRSILLTQQPTVYEEKEIQSSRGTAGSLITLSIDFTFRCGITGEVLIIKDWRGQGQDYGDKALGKAYTNAVKTFIRAQWMLPTSHDDPEGSDPGERVARGHNGAAAAPQVVPPTWAAEASQDAKKAALDALEQVIGDRDQARAFAMALATKCGSFPDVVAKWLGVLPQWIGTKAETEAAAAEATRAAQDAAAEAPQPDPPVDLQDNVQANPPLSPGEQVQADLAAGLAEAKAHVRGELPVDDRLPGSVPFPSLKGLDESATFKALRDAGCVCLDPLADSGHTESCPIEGHGIKF